MLKRSFITKLHTTFFSSQWKFYFSWQSGEKIFFYDFVIEWQFAYLVGHLVPTRLHKYILKLLMSEEGFKLGNVTVLSHRIRNTSLIALLVSKWRYWSLIKNSKLTMKIKIALATYLSIYFLRFWSHMVHEPACIVSVTSFLQEATPYYTPVSSLTSNKNVLQLYKDILTLTLSLLYRLLTEKESEVNKNPLFRTKFLYIKHFVRWNGCRRPNWAT